MSVILPNTSNIATSAERIQALRQLVHEDMTLVDRTIKQELKSDVLLINQCADHITQNAGKRLRPLLTILASHACGISADARAHAITSAVMIECIHTATLLHDDVVDHSKWRRGQPTANQHFGNEISVLVGDFIYSRAFQLMVDLERLDILHLMTNTTNAMAEGEVMQLMHCHKPETTEATYFKVIECKTGKLFAAAASLAALVTQQQDNIVQAFNHYGHHLGLAFQLMDDVLDFYGDPEAIGKSIGDDLTQGTPTLPIIIALKHAKPHEQTLLKEAITHGQTDKLQDVISIVKDSGALDITVRHAEQAIESALAALSNLEPSEYHEALKELAKISIERNY